MKKLFLVVLMSLMGFASLSAQGMYDLFGYGSNATGGGNATPISVDTEQELIDALSGSKSNRVVIITANITVSTQFTSRGSNITLLALPGRCLISNGQSKEQSGILNMRGSNIIIRNVTFIGPGAYDCNGKDLLQFEDATNAWVDHCDFQDGCDGNFDIKSNADNITVTWCRFRYLKPAKSGGSGGAADHRYTNLLGSSEDDKPADGTYNVTYAHNWWDNGCKERMVRCRNCEIHFFNCYWNSDVANYYVGPENAKCYFEGCTFAGKANSKDKIFKSYGGTNACKFVNSVGNLPSDQGTVNKPSYRYFIESASDAVANVTDPDCGAGATLIVETDGTIQTCGATLNKFVVTFNLNGKGTNFTQDVYENRTIAAPANPTTTGFVFDGWYTNQACTSAFDFSTPITANTTLYAKWVQALTVTFNLNGHGDSFTQEVVSGAKASAPSTPVSAGYVFVGWYSDQACTSEYNFNTPVTSAKTLYAKWEESNNCYEFILATSGTAPAAGDVILGAGVGGTMTMIDGTIEYSSNGLAFKSSGSSKVSVTLLTEMQVGTVITLNMYNGTTGERGLKLADGTGDVVGTYTQDGVGDFSASYIVTAGDGLEGTSTFQIHRSNNSFLKSITVSNCGGSSCSNPELAYSTTSIAKTDQDASFTNTLTNPHGLAVAYSSSNTKVATIASNGEVTIKGSGSTIITASAAAQDDYCAATVTYTLTVSATGGAAYPIDETDFPNPERGFYEHAEWSHASTGDYDDNLWDSYFDDARAANRSLLLRIYYLDTDELRQNKQLPNGFITMFNNDMQKIRTNGMKCILRFAYDKDTDEDGDEDYNDFEDASPATWETHLAQLKPYLQANADVIYVVQAGFLGVWGEWYYSSLGTGDEVEWSVRQNLIDQLLDAVPANRYVQLRTPLFKKKYLGNNNPLTSAVAYHGSDQARLGHHNDAFLNGEKNQGTYEDRTEDMKYIAQECLYVPIGGETNLDDGESSTYDTWCKGSIAEKEMAQLHYSYLNHSYSQYVTNQWKAEGSYARMSKQLGYRFELESATLPNEATAGTPMNVQLNIKNVGYAPLYNERYAYIVLKNSTNTYSIPLSSDPRTWAPNNATTAINEYITLPATMAAGTYDLYLYLPDASASIANNPKYAVRFANTGIWESATGYNILNKQVEVTIAACSGANGTGSTFTAPGNTYMQNASAASMSITGVTASNGGALTYQWYKTTSDIAHGELIDGATESTYTPSTAEAHDTWYYYCVVTETGCPVVYTTALSGAIVVNAATYTITYDTDGADSATPTQEAVTEGTTIVLAAPASKANSIFVGWLCDGDDNVYKAGDAYTVTATNTTFTAQWQELGEGCFVVNSTTLGSSTTLADGTQVALGDNCTADANGLSVGSNMLFTAPAGRYFETFTFTATCGSDGKNNYYKINGGSQQTLASSTKAEKTYTIAIPAGTNASTIQIIKSGTTPKVSQICYTFKTEVVIPTYTVTYDANGGSCSTTSENASSVALPTPTRDGYTFNGWYTAATGGTLVGVAGDSYAPSADITLYAQWTANAVEPEPSDEVCVTFEGSSSVSSYTKGDFAMYATDSDGRLNSTSRWGTGKTDCSGSKVYAFENQRFLVKVNVPITSIHFSGYSSSERTIKSVKTSTTADKDSYSNAALVGDTKIGPTKGCQEFKINFSEAIPANTYIWVELSNAMVISTICYTPAPSTPSTYTVTYECNGATSGCPSNATEQTALPNPLPIPTKTGYEFGGWYTDSELTTAAIAGATLSANITLYAQWTENTPVTPDPEPEECTETTITYNLVTHNNKTASQSVSPSGTITSLTGATAIGAAESNTGDPNSSFADYSERYGASATNDNVSDGVTFTFDVPSGYVFKPTAINTNLMCYGVGGSGDTHYYQFVGTLSDATTTIEGEVYPNNADGANADIAYTIPNNASLSGTVTLRLNAVKKGGNYQSFRIKSPITIVGDLCSVDCSTAPAATITWNTQPANGQVGSADFAYAVSCSDGSAVTVTSADPSIATIVDGKLHYVAAGTTHLVASATDACGNEITQNSNDFTVTAASVEPNPGTGEEKYYYGQVAIQNGALVKGITNGMIQFFTVTGGVVENSTALSISSTPSAAGIYYNSNNLTHEELSKSSNWGSSSTANRYIQGMKFKDATTYTLKLGSKTATSIRFYGWCGSSSRKLTIGGVEYTSSSNKNTFFAHEFVKNGSFTGDISISGSGDFYGIIVIDITSLPSCTTPVLSDLENPKVCPGNNVSWTANNTATLQDGETIAYQWNKKGNNTVLSNSATLTLNDITEAAGGTYVVTATVSAEGKASATATKEVTLTVTPATATPAITASASTIFAGNSVTLTASCASSGVTYQWYTCNDAEGTTAQIINDEENATLALTPDKAGTYYYKVIVEGDGTNSCGTAEKVYELVVKTPSAGCYDMIIFDSSNDQTIPAVDATGTEANTGASWANVGTATSSNPCTYTYNDKTYKKGWKFVGGTTKADSRYIQFEIPSGYVGSLFMAGYIISTDRSVFISNSPTGSLVTTYAYIKPSTTNELNTASAELSAGTYYVCATDAFYLTELSIEICSDVNCTDPQVIATVDNATVCEGTENVTFTATNYANGAEFLWQKKDGNTWEDINGATSSDTYTISSVTTEHAGQYRVIAEAGCKRISEEVTLTVLTAPTFNTFATTASVMKGNALAISDVQATNATGYAWYKSSDNSFDAAEDTKVGTSKDLLLAAASITEAADQIFYLFCVASNSCGSVTSNPITVTVTPFISEECATKGNEGDHEFRFTNTSCSSETYESRSAWESNGSKEYLTYTAPTGRYFATAKVTVAHTNNSKAVYGYSTNGGTTWTYKETSSAVPTAYKTITIELPADADVNAFRIGRNMDGKGAGTGKFYLAEACFTYKNACTETTLTVGSYNNEYNISTHADFVEPTFTLKSGETTLEGQTLTYTSSNTAIATVDEDGNVTFEGMTGTVTITATFAGGEISETEYCACQGSYTITVGCKDQAPKIVAAAGTNLNGCNNSITLEAKMQDGTTDFTGGSYQWYRDGEAIDGANSASYAVVRAGTYTVSRTDACITMSTNSAIVTNENVEPEVERLTPFQYYHVDKTYSNQMKDRHLFAVKSYGILDGKRYHLTATKNGETTLNLSSSNAFFTIPSSDNAVDTVMINLNELKDKYAEGDEIVITCAPINSCNNASAITASITIHVIGDKPTLALICSGANGEGTRATKELVVGGDFLTGYNKADLCQQTGNTTFDPNTEWGFYTELKEKYIVTPVNGYAEFNKLNYEPFDILLLTDYPKASKSEAAATILDDMAALCDYRPLLSLKAHMVAKTPSKWAAKGFTTSPVVPAATSQYANIVCYAHPMFDELDDAHVEGIYHDHDDFNQLVYQILTGPGHESSKGLQGFELKDADNFVTIGLIHYNAAAEVVTHTDGDDTHAHLEWTPAADDRQLVAIAERQANIEARMILFAINCGAQSMQTPMGRQVLLTCLDYLLKTDLIEVADCRLTFDNGEGNTNWDESAYEGTGTKGDGLWSTAANWGPEYMVVPGRNNDVRIAAPCTVDAVKTKVLKGEEEQIADAYFPEVLSIHITKDGSLTIPANSSLTARSTILRADENGNVYPTNVADISLGSNEGGNASLILNNERGDTKAGVAMYSKAKADTDTYSEAASTWQYIGTPHSDVANAIYNYYDSWLYQYDTGTETEAEGWVVIPNGGPLVPFRGYCITHPEQGHTYWMEGTLAATTNQDITIPAGKFVVVANSWTAPIQIHELTDDDMEGLTEKTIYFFNTGSDPEGDGELNKENGRYATGTYVSVPIHSASYTGDSYIPSMQGFYVVGGTTDGTLHLDYERHVRAPRTNTPSGPMHAPARRVAADDEPQVAKFLFRGKRYDDRLIILERPDFTRGYDSGWDGEQWGGNAAAPMSYVVAETRYDAVSAIPEYEGTVIGFRAGEDSEYTIHFDYDGMEDALYLLDTDTQIYTRVLKGNSYTFTCADKAEHNRFILTRKAPQIATGTDHINTDENAKAVKFIKDDKIFIFVNGILYDATGKMVIR